jgi:tetratricopeptide (TPR) repeat protein
MDAWWQCIELDDGHDPAVIGMPDLPPFRLRPYLAYAQELRLRGDTVEAIAVLERAVLRWPDDADVHLLFGQCYTALTNWKRAAAAYQRSHEITPSADVCIFLAHAWGHMHCRDEAVHWLRQALVVDPDHDEAHFNLGCMHARIGDVDTAVHHLHRATEIDPAYAIAHAQLGQVLQARAVGQRLRDPTHSDWARARAHLVRATALNPEDGWSHAYLATLCEIEEQFEEAELHHQAATQLLPTVGVLWSNYGSFLLSRGNGVEAERLFRYAVSLDPDDPNVRYWLGKYLWGTANYADARTELRHAHRLGHRRALAWLKDRAAKQYVGRRRTRTRGARRVIDA